MHSSPGRVLVVFAALFACVLPAKAAPDPAVRCESKKNLATGRFYACIAKAEAAKVLTGDDASYASSVTACALAVEGAFAKEEERAGSGVCPSSDDADGIEAVGRSCAAALSSSTTGGPLSPQVADCNRSLLECQSALGRCTSEPLVRVLPSGQTKCYGVEEPIPCLGTGQDGERRTGVPSRFVNNGDGTITDGTTGLTWEVQDDSGSIHDMHNIYTWPQVFARVADLNGASFAGFADWRVPNVRELLTLVNYGATDPATHDPFDDACMAACTAPTCSCTDFSGRYATSTTVISELPQIWYVDFHRGQLGTNPQASSLRSRAVRGGV